MKKTKKELLKEKKAALKQKKEKVNYIDILSKDIKVNKKKTYERNYIQLN